MRNNKINMDSECWKHIEGFPSYYEASNYGRVRVLTHSSKDGRTIKKHILSQHTTSDGYLAVNHLVNGITGGVHNLVARAFLTIPNNIENYEVNHIDEDKHNNRVDNLEWCTRKYNVNYGNRTRHQLETMASNGSIDRKYLNGFFIINPFTKNKELYYSVKKCAEDFNLSHSAILDCLNKKKVHSKTAKGYYFCFKDDYTDEFLRSIKITHKNGKQVRRIKAVNVKTGKVIVANTQKELAGLIGGSNGNISMALNSPVHHTVKGYKVSYIN